MKFAFFCPKWGLEDLSYEAAAVRVKAAGYDGMEIAAPVAEAAQAIAAMKAHGLQTILMAFGGSAKFDEHKTQFRKDLEALAAAKPLFINTHTGKDFFTFEQNCQLIQVAAEVQKATGINILHETHRGRFTYSLPAIDHYFVTFPELRLTGDFSHWVNVSESYLGDQADSMARAMARTDHIHSRVGHPEGPQVNDPRAPEWEGAVKAHLAWWDKIVEIHRKKGTPMLTITSEFGPAPGYLPTLPYSNLPVASQWDINVYMMQLLRKRYA
ncbi:MAG: sugar phosphate isomerase/epimerase [Cytophagia bacterium]|jgi:sugar phosphate isomerase/epimerase|nr:MAG: sugar phosphate isomerase/epimerase [Runella sp.]TAG18416.1 MAG: sugar phosphate isomerase/epimerase [Cytophagales bacterium]TAG37934.1 MAG: sugar phosphate isomerase/epimerase [Cytophagia bacterium]TAG53670.1 MAG: sugar phosphate isomerase/epimerase [Runella slithyformis]TAG72437.1 MAG: sugar phosphate isomerase/epimerase [Runella slithyformis]